MKRNRLFLSGSIFFIVLFLVGISPMIYYYLKLPSSSEIKQGAVLNQLFSNFSKKFISSVDIEVSNRMICLSCIRPSSLSKNCADTMASYISKNLADSSQGMTFWHLSNFFLTKTITFKYSEKEIQQLHYSFIANNLHEISINSLCQNVLKKDCMKLDKSEFLYLESVFLSGKLSPPKYPHDSRFDSCFTP